jgi:hypothetical protein
MQMIAVDRCADRGGDQIGRHDPRQLAIRAEFAADRRKRGNDDGLIEGCQKDADQHSGHHTHDFGVGKAR